MTRNATEPAASSTPAVDHGDSGVPMLLQLSTNAFSSSATDGPCRATPVSRQGAMFFDGSPSHFSLMHTPDRKPCTPSTTSSLR